MLFEMDGSVLESQGGFAQRICQQQGVGVFKLRRSLYCFHAVCFQQGRDAADQPVDKAAAVVLHAVPVQRHGPGRQRGVQPVRAAVVPVEERAPCPCAMAAARFLSWLFARWLVVLGKQTALALSEREGSSRPIRPANVEIGVFKGLDGQIVVR